jgi:hypothetical protein
MADQESTIKTSVVLDTTQAQVQIVKLNAVASDSTKTLEERLEAKNKAVELQNKLNKQTVAGLEKEIKSLEGLEGKEKDIIKLEKKLSKAKLASAKASANGAKASNKLSDALEDSKSATLQLDDVTGGLLGKMKAFATNPIGAVITAITAVFLLLKNAVGRSGKASETFGKIAAKLSGVMNGLMAVLEPVVEFLGEKLLQALEDPGQAIEDLGNTIKENLINRVKSFLVLGDAIAEFFKGNFKKAGKLATDSVIQFSTGVTDATDKISELAEVAKKKFNEAAIASEGLANAERRLQYNRIELEKLQLKSLTAAEKERQIRDDTTRSIEERIEANKRLGKILDEQSQAELELAQDTLALAYAQQRATGDTIENIEAVGAAEVKLLEIQERITGQRSEQLVNESGLIKERAQLLAAAAATQIEVDRTILENKKILGEQTYELELEQLEKSRILELQNTELTEEGKALIEAKYKLQKDELAIEEAERIAAKREADFEAQTLIDELDIERRRKQGENVLALELELLERKRVQELENHELTETQKAAINAKYEDAKAQITETSEKAITASKEQAKDQAIAFTAEAFGIEQEAAVARMIMAAPEAIGHSFKKAAEAYAPPMSLIMGGIGAASTIVPIIKGLNDIRKTRFSKSKSSGGGGGSISPATSGPARATTNAISDIAANNSARLGVDPSLGANSTAEAANRVTGSSSPTVTFSESRYNDFKNQVNFKEDKTSI